MKTLISILLTFTLVLSVIVGCVEGEKEKYFENWEWKTREKVDYRLLCDIKNIGTTVTRETRIEGEIFYVDITLTLARPAGDFDGYTDYEAIPYDDDWGDCKGTIITLYKNDGTTVLDSYETSLDIKDPVIE